MTPTFFKKIKLQSILIIFRLFLNFKIKSHFILLCHFSHLSSQKHFQNQSNHILFFYAISASYPLKNFFQTSKSTKTNHSTFYPKLHDFDPIRVYRQKTMSFQINKITKTFFFLFTHHFSPFTLRQLFTSNQFSTR